MPRKAAQPPVDLEFTLRRVFGKTSFKEGQREVILATLEKHDVFVQAATGFGKSLCFQLPAVIDHGITIVVSPLLALMKNQVSFLQAAGIEAASINSTTSPEDRNRIYADLGCGHPKIKLLYVTPEQCTYDYFRKHLKTVHRQRELSRIAIDEAHCISEWGHDFRPSFKELGFFKKEFPDVPLICLTATSTRKVQNDILKTLGLAETWTQRNVRIFRTTTVRLNLHYEVRFKSDDSSDFDCFDDFVTWFKDTRKRYEELPSLMPEVASNGNSLSRFCGIIYTHLRRDCESLAAGLRIKNIGARPFHAGLSNAEKDSTLTGWLGNSPDHEVIVATTAFGMGIDKENVRFVVHWQIPKSFEGFYQEAGRAGRDGKASRCIVYYSREDRERTLTQVMKDHPSPSEKSRVDSLKALINYCETTKHCRHQIICDFFGEQTTVQCDYACDFHRDPDSLKSRKKENLLDEMCISTPAMEDW